MRELPILFNQDMVRALLDGRKTQTRRPLKVQPSNLDEFSRYIESKGYNYYFTGCRLWYGTDKYDKKIDVDYIEEVGGKRDYPKAFAKMLINEGLSPYKVGDMLYCRERAKFCGVSSVKTLMFEYEADKTRNFLLEMPDRIKRIKEGQCCPNGCFKELARIWLKVTNVRCERLKDISEADAIAEGIDTDGLCVCPEDEFIDGIRSCLNCGERAEDLTEKFRETWQSCYPGSWERNDWVFVYEFERVER